MALGNQSGRLSELGRREDALAAIEEAVTIYRQLARYPPADLRCAVGGQSESPGGHPGVAGQGFRGS